MPKLFPFLDVVIKENNLSNSGCPIEEIISNDMAPCLSDISQNLFIFFAIELRYLSRDIKKILIIFSSIKRLHCCRRRTTEALKNINSLFILSPLLKSNMVIIGLAICSNSFSPIFSRSYSEINVKQINYLVSVASRSPNEPFIDINCSRVIVSNLGTYILCLITNTYSNPIIDTSVINLIERQFSNKKYGLSNDIAKDIFEIVIFLDEIIGIETVNCHSFESLQICLGMESKEEELQEAMNKVIMFLNQRLKSKKLRK